MGCGNIRYKSGKCIFYIRTDQIDLIFPQGIPQETIDEQNEIYDKLEGREGTCKFDAADLKAMLERWKVGTFSGGTSCTLLSDGTWDCEYTGDFEEKGAEESAQR